MNQEEINAEVEEKGNFFLLWEENNANEKCCDFIERFENFCIAQENAVDSRWKRLKNKSILYLNNIKFINILINNI